MWNDTNIPLAYLVTFRCYGTWLHGDERGSTDRRHNAYRSPHIPNNEKWKRHNTRALKCAAVTLNADQRSSIETAIRETCTFRRWLMHAISSRTNHVHVVVSIGTTNPSRALNAFKANATRQMREDRNWTGSHSPWADKGSQRHLWNERSLALAMDYVVNGQGDDLPEFN
ncbi:MAG: transposase [Pyrinomonadaceae bacterium]